MHNNNRLLIKQAVSISKKRFAAIKKALAQGKTDYEFEVEYTPILNK